ncbi:MAG: hypothetical protein AAFP04_09545 [Myxococcota bacterium]
MKLLKSVGVCLAVLTFSVGSVQALKIKERKAVKKGKEDVAAAVKPMKEACKSNAMKVSVDWDAMGKLTESAKKQDRTLENLISVGSSTAVDMVNSFTRLCADEDYREAMSEIKEIKMVPTGVEEKPWHRAKRTGGVLKLTFYATGTVQPYDVKEAISEVL